jgi:hypothetical protein
VVGVVPNQLLTLQLNERPPLNKRRKRCLAIERLFTAAAAAAAAAG